MAFDASVGLGGNVVLQPSSTKQLAGTNYVSSFGNNAKIFADGVTDATGANAGQPFLPELMEKEVSRFGPEGLVGILDRLGGKIPFANPEIKWAEKGRLHTLYTDVTFTTAGAAAVFTRTGHIFRVGQTLHLEGSVGEAKGVITAITANTFTVAPYNVASITAAAFAPLAEATIKARVYGSDFGKGTYGMTGSIESQTEVFSVRPIIFKDHYKLNGSDLSQVGWIQGVDAAGATSYLWYIKSKSDTMKRWNDYLEMGLIEGVGGGAAADIKSRYAQDTPAVVDDNYRYPLNQAAYGAGTPANQQTSVGGDGVQGLFAQIESRGHEFDAFFSGSGPASTSQISQWENDIEDIILALDEQAGIANYSWFVNREVSLNIDRWLATKNSMGAVNLGPNTTTGGTTTIGGSATTGTAQYFGEGLSVNSADKMYEFGFKGFSWADYTFMKSTWDYLIDPTMRGGMGDINGLMLPMGTTTVKDISGGGNNVARPYVYIAYKTSPVDNRMNKEWITGSVGAYTDDEDAMKCHFLSERSLVVQAANNFVILK